MGNSASFSNKIHVSISTKFTDYDKIINKLIHDLTNKGIHVTKTDPSHNIQELCNTISNADIIIYCNSKASPCCSQAIEYSYLIENTKTTYNLIIDPYNDGFTDYLQGFLQNGGISIKNQDDVKKIVDQINNRIVPC